MKTDGKKLIGRFIKKSSTLLHKVSLEEFNFDEEFEGEVVDTDNMNRNIVHSKYHTEEQQEVFKVPKNFETDLLPANMKRPVLRPVDFTDEWEAERTRDKAKPGREEEDFNMFFNQNRDSDPSMTSADAAKASKGGKSVAEMTEDEKEQYELDLQYAEMTGENPAKAGPLPPSGAPETASLNPTLEDQSQNLDVIGDAINNLVQTEEAPLGMPSLTSDDPTAFVAESSKTDANPAGAPAPAAEAAAEELDQPEVADFTDPLAEPKEDFIPAATSAIGDEVHDPETNPSNQYKQQVQINASSKEIAEVFEEAKSNGYEEGYKHGEAKAELQTRERTTKVFGKVGDIVKEFESLKGTILENVQQNFYELSQAIAESLLKRELKVNPKAFAEVVRRAIDEAVEPDTFKINVNPEMFDEIKTLDIDSISNCLVKDPNVELGDFRIESDLSVVDGNIHKVVADLLSQADLELFESNTSDDSDNDSEDKAS